MAAWSVSQPGGEMGTPARVAGVRARGMLRFEPRQTCDQAFSPHEAAVMRSIEPGEQWGGCFVEEVMVELEQG